MCSCRMGEFGPKRGCSVRLPLIARGYPHTLCWFVLLVNLGPCTLSALASHWSVGHTPSVDKCSTSLLCRGMSLAISTTRTISRRG